MCRRASNSSCCRALFMFNESVRYFIRRGSRVHCSALDASKALRLDKVLHFGLFYKIVSKSTSSMFIIGSESLSYKYSINTPWGQTRSLRVRI